MSNRNPKFKVGGLYKRYQDYLFSQSEQDYVLVDEQHFLLLEKVSEKTSPNFKKLPYWIVSCLETGEQVKLSEEAMRSCVKFGKSEYQN